MPWIEWQAKAERGFAAFGGKYLIPVMSTIIGVVILWIVDEQQKEKERKQREKYKSLEFVSYAKKCDSKMRQNIKRPKFDEAWIR